MATKGQMTKLKSHPYADLFPMMTQTELDALAIDISANGLRQPIVLYDKQILDGRNRYLACDKAAVDPDFKEFEGDDAAAFSLVISLNAQRREMTAAQRAIVAARALPFFEEKAKSRQGKKTSGTDSAGSRARDDAAKVFKVGPNAVQQAKAVLEDAPDLITQLELLTLSLADAYKQLQERRKQAAQKEKDAERIAEFKEAISNGQMTMDEALQVVMVQERDEKAKLASQADARQNWLKEFVTLVEWIERFPAGVDDEHLAWYTEPDSPGLYDHGMTAERVAQAIAQLERVRTFTFGRSNENGKQRSKKTSRRAV